MGCGATGDLPDQRHQTKSSIRTTPLMKSTQMTPVRPALIPSLQAIFAALAIALCLPAVAEVEKTATAGSDGIEMYWWPKLPPLDGWSQDRVASLQYGANVLTPAGKSFADADTVMYARAQFKPRVPDIKSLSELIDRDRKDYSERAGGLKIKESARLKSADGHWLDCLIHEPTSLGNWERVCYLEEGNYYLMFILSAQNRPSFGHSMKAFEALVARYHE
jgi:hypothetical protein